ncbi:MAG: flagellum-specific ATP synthase [Kiritimatiellia bacterium]|jgi:flagellum-specific ATP synthase
MIRIDDLVESMSRVRVHKVKGRLLHAVGPLLEAELPGAIVGGLVTVGQGCLCEVVGFRERRTLLMPLDTTSGIGFGTEVLWKDEAISVAVGEELLGRVLDGFGRPIDGGPPLSNRVRRPVFASAPDPLGRKLISEPMPTGVRVLDGLLTIGKGQRISIMAGSGVGKSTLLGMIARYAKAHVNVVCLVGERGREVREFLEHNLGGAGLARTVMVVVTGEKSAALQVKGAFLATTIAEWFRDQGMDVLMLMDSLTRLAQAQRQIGLAAGEPPTRGGYTPSVFALLPQLLERAGPGDNGGSITGIYTVLVDGDDIHDPVGDAVRGIVDGHVVLSRKLASHGQYPAVDVLASLSRLMNRVADPRHLKAAQRFRDLLATWRENEELIRLGAYRKGTSAAVDEAVERYPSLRAFLCQGVEEPVEYGQLISQLCQAVGV